MYRNLIILAIITRQINCDCLHPEWKQTCQKFCMDNQLYEIQLNQCYSMNPTQLKCRCGGQDLTEKIREMLENQNSNPTTTIPSSTTVSITRVDEICVPSKPCTIGKVICKGFPTYCTCDNGTWSVVSCPPGNICNTQGSMTSCQKSNIIIDRVMLSFDSDSAIILKQNSFFELFIFCFFIMRIRAL